MTELNSRQNRVLTKFENVKMFVLWVWDAE